MKLGKDNLNQIASNVIDYCDKNKVMLLRFDLTEQKFIIEQENGTPTLCSFDELNLQSDKPSKMNMGMVYDYHEVIEYIEKKYGIDTRDYAGSNKHFRTWLKIVNEYYPNYPKCIGSEYVVLDYNKNENVKITKEEYDRRNQYIRDQYKRFTEWEINNPEPPYLDFWHWLLENDFSNVHNGCKQYIDIKNWLDRLDEDFWVRKIFQLIYDEFQEEEMYFWIEW